MIPALSVSGLSKAFGGLTVADGVSLALAPGDRVALIGPNGAGKTTFVNLVAGALKPDGGRVGLAGRDLTGADEVGRVRAGLARTFQVNRLFRDLTVREHLHLAILRRRGLVGRMWGDARRAGPVRDEADALMAGLGLLALAERPVGAVAYGFSRLVEMGMALALRPKVLLLDEPAAGVPGAETGRITAALDGLPPDLAVLMIEHDMDLVFRFARRVAVLAAGRLIAEGAPDAIAADPAVRTAYLGAYARRVA